ncbi:MAG: hypothetical protein AMS27_00760, partial [Bacteroides sp. SM23_62_1]
METFADVILPLYVAGTFTYRVPDNYVNQVKTGMRVLVPFGRRKIYSGIILHLHHSPPSGFQIRDIRSVIDSIPIVNTFQLDFWKWIMDYYLCSPGEVMKASIPAGLKMESETFYSLKKIPGKDTHLEKEETKVITVLENKNVLSLKELKKQIRLKELQKWLDMLIARGILATEERIREKYRPKTETFVGINDVYLQRGTLDKLFSSFNRAPKQYNLLQSFLNIMNKTSDEITEVKKQDLQNIQGYSESAFQALTRKNILTVQKKEITRLPDTISPISALNPLTSVQQSAFDEIKKIFQDKKVALLHGITSSGKTEIYFHLIKEQIRNGRQVLYLLPEIVLTAQIVRRLKAVFGSLVGIYHSRYSDAERVETYLNLLGISSGSPIQIILGARSAIFLPFNNLGLIIV